MHRELAAMEERIFSDLESCHSQFTSQPQLFRRTAYIVLPGQFISSSSAILAFDSHTFYEFISNVQTDIFLPNFFHIISSRIVHFRAYGKYPFFKRCFHAYFWPKDVRHPLLLQNRQELPQKAFNIEIRM